MSEGYAWVTMYERLQSTRPKSLIQPYLDRVEESAKKCGRRLDPTPKYCVYSLRVPNAENPSFYIGKGKDLGRPWDHIAGIHSCTHTSHKNNTIKKALRSGKGLLIEILHKNLSEKMALALEMGWIAHWGRSDIKTGFLTNLTDGGEGVSGVIASSATRAKRRKVWEDPEYKEYQKACRKAEWRTPEYRERQIALHNTTEFKARISELKRTPEQRLISILTVRNPLFSLVTAHVETGRSLVKCRYCGGEVVRYNTELMSGILPRAHYKCATKVFRIHEGSLVYSTGRSGYKQLQMEIPTTPFTSKIVSAGIIFYTLEGTELSREKLPREYTMARLEGEQVLAGRTRTTARPE